MPEKDQMVIVIEDDKDDQLLIKTFAEQAKIAAEVVFLDSGEQLDFYLFRDTLSDPFSFLRIPALIVLDLNLRGKSGIEVLMQLKAHSYFCKIPVVVLSTSTNLADVNKCYSLGCAGYFAKPNHESEWIELMTAIRSYWFQCAFRPLMDSF